MIAGKVERGASEYATLCIDMRANEMLISAEEDGQAAARASRKDLASIIARKRCQITTASLVSGVLADVGVPGPPGFGGGGAGVAVAAAVGGPVVGPSSIPPQPPPAPAAGQQPGQQVPPGGRPGRSAGCGRVLGGDEIGLADQRRMRGITRRAAAPAPRSGQG